MDIGQSARYSARDPDRPCELIRWHAKAQVQSYPKLRTLPCMHLLHEIGFLRQADICRPRALSAVCYARTLSKVSDVHARADHLIASKTSTESGSCGMFCAKISGAWMICSPVGVLRPRQTIGVRGQERHSFGVRATALLNTCYAYLVQCIWAQYS